MKPFSRAWKSSSKVSKQRKFRLNAPLHTKRKFLAASVSRELRGRLGHIVLVRTGDTAKITLGEFKGVTGKVNKINLRKGTVYVDGAERIRRDGTKSLRPIQPSNLIITEAGIDDKRRSAAIARRTGGKTGR